MGRKAADLYIKDGKLVNVNVGYIQEHIDVAVSNGFIAYVGREAKSRERENRLAGLRKRP